MGTFHTIDDIVAVTWKWKIDCNSRRTRWWYNRMRWVEIMLMSKMGIHACVTDVDIFFRNFTTLHVVDLGWLVDLNFFVCDWHINGIRTCITDSNFHSHEEHLRNAVIQKTFFSSKIFPSALLSNARSPFEDPTRTWPDFTSMSNDDERLKLILL